MESEMRSANIIGVPAKAIVRPWLVAGYGIPCFKHWQVDCPTCG